MKMTKKQRVEKILELLDEHYGTEKICYLDHENPWQLLIAVILSAQCTDARVNIVTGPLFERYPSAGALADADVSEVENLIHSVGFYKNKARNIILASRKIVQDFGGEVLWWIPMSNGYPINLDLQRRRTRKRWNMR